MVVTGLYYIRKDKDNSTADSFYSNVMEFKTKLKIKHSYNLN